MQGTYPKNKSSSERRNIFIKELANPVTYMVSVTGEKELLSRLPRITRSSATMYIILDFD